MLKLQIEYVPLDSLRSASTNARVHNRNQRRKLRRALKQFGFLIPIVIDDNGRIICGHLRVEEAKALGLGEVPAIRATHLTPAEIEAFALAENRISDDGSYDKGALRQIFVNILELDETFDLTDTGFDTAEIDLTLMDGGGDDDDVPATIDRESLPVTKLGDCWRVGEHVIVCGDARDAEAYALALRDGPAQVVIGDVPYNVRIAGNVSGLGAVKHGEFAMASGEMSPAEFTAFLDAVAKQLVAASVDGSIHYLFMDFRHMAEMLGGAGPHYSELKNLCVWVKRSGGMGSLYRSQHELVFVFKAGTAPHINNVELGRHGRTRTNVWEYAGANSFGATRDALALHPTVKPIDLLADAILDCSDRGAIVLDPFLGSGSTIIAAHRTGRRGSGIELDPHYVDVAVRRIAEATGSQPVLLSTGEPFEVVAHRRANPGWEVAA